MKNTVVKATCETCNGSGNENGVICRHCAGNTWLYRIVPAPPPITEKTTNASR